MFRRAIDGIPPCISNPDDRPDKIRSYKDRSYKDRADGRMRAHIGGRLRLRREALGLSVALVAVQVGWDAEDLRACEAGIGRVAAFDLYRLACALDLTIGSLFADAPMESVTLLRNAADSSRTTDWAPVYRIPHAELLISAFDVHSWGDWSPAG